MLRRELSNGQVLLVHGRLPDGHWELELEGAKVDRRIVGWPLNSTLADLVGYHVGREDWPGWIDQLADEIQRTCAIPSMKLHTPLEADQADSVERGEGFPEGDFSFVDHPEPDEAPDDAAWIVIEIPEAEALPFEQAPTELGYREYLIPGTVASRFTARRVELP
jgi:hypothetical protein